ncbi:TPA: hypothetical protein ACXYPN_003160 [Escherichia coli]
MRRIITTRVNISFVAVLAARQDWVSNDDLAEKITSLVDKILVKDDI